MVNEANTNRNQPGTAEGYVGACEMDSHANTCCLGMNFAPVYFTGKVCNVSPFLSDLPSQQGVQIALVPLPMMLVMVSPCKARLVAGSHTTETPASLTYSSVVSRESVQVAILLAALNDLDLFAADVGNAYLNAPCWEKIWCKAGKEFGSDKGCIMIIVHALYGLKTSGAAWRAAFAEKLAEMGYKSTKADPDVWIQQAVKPNGLFTGLRWMSLPYWIQPLPQGFRMV